MAGLINPALKSFLFRYREVFLMSVLGPTTEILSFALPKESIQRKGNPDAAYSLRSSGLSGVFRRGLPAPAENAMHPCIAPAG
ncbi:hypothetical protein, partial [Methylomonas rivi]